jgi:hypothetical protein
MLSLLDFPPIIGIVGVCGAGMASAARPNLIRIGADASAEPMPGMSLKPGSIAWFS